MGKAQRGETGGISAGEHDGELQSVVQRSVFGTGFVHYGGHDHGQQQRVADIEQADLHGGQHGVQRGGFFGKGKRGKDGHLNGEQHAHQAAAAVFSGKQASGITAVSTVPICLGVQPKSVSSGVKVVAVAA